MVLSRSNVRDGMDELMPPKTTEIQYRTRSESSYAFTGGMKEILELQAQAAIAKLFRCLGQNARGEFRFRITFVPDGKEKS